MNHVSDIRMRGFLRRTPIKDFLKLIKENSIVLPAEKITTSDASGRILAQSIIAPENVPNFDRSAMDGYALDGESTFGASSYNPLTFHIVGQITPGETYEGIINEGETLRIMTGAKIPKGTNAVLMAENAEILNDAIQVISAVSPGKNVGKTGEDIVKNQILFYKNRCLRPQDIGLITSLGLQNVKVVRKPTVELFITGNELLKPGDKPKGVQIVDSNSVMLSPMIDRDGGILRRTIHLPDEREQIREYLNSSSSDLICITGGTSVGVEDHGPSLLSELGELLVHGIPMRPAAPTGFGLIEKKKVFLLPGNPVSCLSAYDYFVGRSLRMMSGKSGNFPYRKKKFKLGTKISSEIGRTEYVRLRVENEIAYLIATGGASILSTTSNADGFLLTDEDSEGYAEGEEVSVWLYD